MIEQLTLDKFLSQNRIAVEDWHACNLPWEELLLIGIDHQKNCPDLDAAAILLASIIQRFDQVHSVRWRVKDAEHLLAKIVRKRAANAEKYREISAENYTDIVTDLVGIRALHLFKTDCFDIGTAILNSFNVTETPTAYIREGDDLELSEQYRAVGMNVQQHLKGYRSVHYVLTTQPLKRALHVEIQVRTIFEEGWSEIDHSIRYPNFSENIQLAYLLAIFNRMAGSADEVGGFVRTLAKVLSDAEREVEEAVRERDVSLTRMEAALEQLASKQNSPVETEQITQVKTELSKLKGRVRPADIAINSENIVDYISGSNALAKAIKSAQDPSGLAKAIKDYEGSSANKLANAIKKIQDPCGTAALLKAAQDYEGSTANMLANTIKEIQDPSGTAALLKAAQEYDGSTANMLANAVKSVQDPSGTAALVKAAQDYEGSTANMLANAVKNVQDPSGTAALAKAIQDYEGSSANKLANAIKNIPTTPR